MILSVHFLSVGGSGNGTSLCTDGDVRGEQITSAILNINREGEVFSNSSLLLTTCVGGSYGGVCRRGTDNVDAAVACQYLGYGQ